MIRLGLGSHFKENPVPPTCFHLVAVTRAVRHACVHSRAKATVRRCVRRRPLQGGALYAEAQTWKSSRYSVNLEYKSCSRQRA